MHGNVVKCKLLDPGRSHRWLHIFARLLRVALGLPKIREESFQLLNIIVFIWAPQLLLKIAHGLGCENQRFILERLIDLQACSQSQPCDDSNAASATCHARGIELVRISARPLDVDGVLIVSGAKVTKQHARQRALQTRR